MSGHISQSFITGNSDLNTIIYNASLLWPKKNACPLESTVVSLVFDLKPIVSNHTLNFFVIFVFISRA